MEKEIKFEEYDINSFSKFLEGQGFEFTDVPIWSYNDMSNYHMKYVKSKTNSIEAYIMSEPNLAGVRPEFRYAFRFSADTDKISDPISVEIVYTTVYEGETS